MSQEVRISRPKFFTAAARRCALLVIDMQIGFVAEGEVFETPEARAMIPRIESLIRFCRERGMPIVWTQSDHRPPYAPEIPSHWRATSPVAG